MYCTVRDVRNALAPSGVPDDATSDASKMPDWQIIDAINEATGVVKSYIASRYTINVSSVQEENPDDIQETWTIQVAAAPVRGWTRNIAAYLATLTFRRSKDIGEDDPIRLRYNMTVDHMTAVRDGKTDLDLPPVDGGGTSDVVVLNQYEGQLFGMADTGLGYGSDSQVYLSRWGRI